MVATLSIICVLLLGSVALNFLFIRMLKNTLERFMLLYDYSEIQDNIKMGKAYDDKYYPGHVVAQLKYGCPQGMIVADFSMYETHKIIGITVCESESFPEEEFTKMGLTREMVEQPQFHRNVTVFQPSEGMWSWK